MKQKLPTIHPAADFLLVKRDPETKVSEGGIIIPPPKDKFAGRIELRRGTVLAVGPGRWSEDGSKRVPMGCKVGDVVLFPPVFQGIEQKGKVPGAVLKDDELMLRDPDVWAIEEATS